MAKRQRTSTAQHHHPHASPSRTQALVVAGSSLFLSTGLATLTWVWTAALERELASDNDAAVDMDGMVVVAWWAGDAAVKWALLSAGGSLCGTLGLLLRRSSLHRVFAVTTATDLLVTILSTLALASLTLSPSLSGPFGSFLCSSTFASDWTSTRSDQAASTWAGGIDLLFWGVEACEETWQTAMLSVLAGCVVAVVLRAFGTWVTWECNSDMRERELRDRGEAWVDEQDGGARLMRQVDEAAARGAGDYKTPLALEETLGRPRSCSHSASSASSSRRSQTLPLPYGLDSAKRIRSQSVSYGPTSSSRAGGAAGRHPQLVLVPVMLDERGNPVFQPSSPTYTLPPYSSSPPRTRQSSSLSHSTGSPSSSRSSSRSSTKRPRIRSSSSSSGSSSLASPLSAVFVDEPVQLSPPCTPTVLSSSTMKSADDKTSRRLRPRGEDVGLMSPPPL